MSHLTRQAIVLLTAIALGAAACVPPQGAPIQQEVERHISVNGIATIDVPADRCRLTLTLTQPGKDAKQAVASLQDKRAALIDALDAAGWAGDAVHLGHLNVAPVYGQYSGRHTIARYDASITLVVELSDFGRIGTAMQLAAAQGVGHMSTSFHSSKMPEHKKRARDLAIQAAQAKATQMADAVGVNVGEILYIQETQSFNPGRWALGNASFASPSSDGGLTPGAIPLSLAIDLRYAIR